jgi:hypothetical protein
MYPNLSQIYWGIFNMRKTLLMTTGLAWLALGGVASAAPLVTLSPGPADPQYFASLGAGQSSVWPIRRSIWNGQHDLYVRSKRWH